LGNLRLTGRRRPPAGPHLIYNAVRGVPVGNKNESGRKGLRDFEENHAEGKGLKGFLSFGLLVREVSLRLTE